MSAINLSVQCLMPIVECIVDFFGSDCVLFGTDTPFDTKDGSHSIPVTISAAEGAVHDDAAGAAIFEGNSRRILGIDA